MSDAPDQKETTVLRILQWVFFALGLGCTLAFVFEPDIHAHPQLVLLGGTGLLGALSLWVLRTLLGSTRNIELD